MLKEELWMKKTTAKVTILKRTTKMEDSDILKEIKNNNTREKEMIQALEKGDNGTWEENGIVYMDGRIYVPNSRKIKKKILQENHDLVDMRHLEQQRMLNLIKRNYWWPGFKEDIKKYVQGCFKCQQNKIQYQKKAGELHPLEIPQEP